MAAARALRTLPLCPPQLLLASSSASSSAATDLLLLAGPTSTACRACCSTTTRHRPAAAAAATTMMPRRRSNRRFKSSTNATDGAARSSPESDPTAPAPAPAPRFSYHVAASYVAKGLHYDAATHVFHFNPYNRMQAPKRKGKAQRPESGQDAFFVSRLGGSASGVALGVADGVGGWMDSGVDPADFSHAFCDAMAAAAYGASQQQQQPGHSGGEGRKKGGLGGASIAAAVRGARGGRLTARQLMQKGYEAVCHDRTIKAGGSTAIVGLLGEDGTLEVANLGDSGFIHLRLNAVHAHSEPQTHAFNTPYQLSVVPPSVFLRAAAFGGAQLMDHPRDAEVTRHALRHGDVLVFASDGLWDNLFNQEILRIVSRAMTRSGAWAPSGDGVRVTPLLTPYTEPEPEPEDGAAANNNNNGNHAAVRPPTTLQSLVATDIVTAAKAASLNRKLDSPFSKGVKKYFPYEVWHGGKEDDICVVAVVVTEEQPAKARL